MGRRIAIAGVVGLLWLVGGTASAATPAGTLVSGKIYLRQYSCSGDPQPWDVPFGGAALVLDRPGNPIPTVAWPDKWGRFSAEVQGSGAVEAELILQDRDHLLKVIPDGGTGDAYRLSGFMHPGDNGEILLTGPGADAANVFLVGLRAAEYVRDHGIKVPEATFDVHSAPAPQGDQDGSYYVRATKTIHINGWRSLPSLDNAWEPFTIVHEYGHHVLGWTAPVPSQPGGTHYVDKVYPGIPALAYNEGFAHAFAALVLGKTDLGYGCQDLIHLGSVPARPLANRPAFAQFNETAAGAVMWRVMKRIGLHDFIVDMIGYKHYAGHYPDDMRQVREALVPSEHGSAAKHVTFDQIFGQQNLRWGTLVSLTYEPLWSGTMNGTDMYYETHLILTGPYGSCEVGAKPGPYDSDPSGNPMNPFTPQRPKLTAYPSPQYSWDSDLPGALPYTWQDECLVNTADGTISPTYGPISVGTGGIEATGYGMPSVETLFPYLARAAQHKSKFTLSARFVCVAPAYSDDPGENQEPVADQESCAGGGFALEAYNGLVKGLDDKVISNHYGPAGPDARLRDANYWTTRRIALPINQDVPLVQWSANGVCKVIITGQNCSTATIAR